MIAVTLIVGVILFQAIAQEVGSSTSTTTVVEESIGATTNDTAIYLTNYRSLSDVILINGTAQGGVVIDEGNYTVTNNVIDPTTGGLSVSILPQADVSIYGQTWYLNATAQPVTYIADSGSRAIAGLIIVFFALAIAVVALLPVFKSEVLGR